MIDGGEGHEAAHLRTGTGNPREELDDLLIQRHGGFVYVRTVEVAHQRGGKIIGNARVALRSLVNQDAERYVRAGADVVLDHGPGEDGVAVRVLLGFGRCPVQALPFSVVRMILSPIDH